MVGSWMLLCLNWDFLFLSLAHMFSIPKNASNSFLAQTGVHVENDVISLAHSRKHLVVNPLGRLLQQHQEPMGLKAGQHMTQEGAPENVTFWPSLG